MPLTLRSNSLGKAFHRCAALGCNALLRRLFGRFHLVHAHGVVLEDLNGRRHLADFIATIGAGNRLFELAVSQRFHAAAEKPQRKRNAAADQPGNRAGKHTND